MYGCIITINPVSISKFSNKSNLIQYTQGLTSYNPLSHLRRTLSSLIVHITVHPPFTGNHVIVETKSKSGSNNSIKGEVCTVRLHFHTRGRAEPRQRCVSLCFCSFIDYVIIILCAQREDLKKKKSFTVLTMDYQTDVNLCSNLASDSLSM